MNKKIIIITLLAALLTTTLPSTLAVAGDSSKEKSSSSSLLFESEISIEVPSELDEPIMPSLDESKSIDITVKYRLLNMGRIAQWFYYKSRIGRSMLFGPEYFDKQKPLPSAEISLTLEQPPDWCIASIDPTNVMVEISPDFKEADSKATVKIYVKKDAPAFELNEIKIIAEFKNTHGWAIKDARNETSISFMPDYLPVIDATISTAYLMISPVNETIIPVFIENLGNGKTTVKAEIVNPPENWTISIDQETTLDIGETKQIDMRILPDKNFEKDIIHLKITPMYYKDSNLTATPYDFKIVLENDGSLEEENGISGFEIISLVIAVCISIMLLKKKKQ